MSRFLLRVQRLLMVLAVLGMGCAYGFVCTTPVGAIADGTPPPPPPPCPAIGKPVMPALHTVGKQQAIVYSTESSTTLSTTFRIFNTATKRTTTLPLPTKIAISVPTARLLPDGQWLLFQNNKDGNTFIQMVRLDGKYLQSIYCTPDRIDALTLSPDQATLVFDQIHSSMTSRATTQLLSLNMHTGHVQAEAINPTPGYGYVPHEWLNSHSLYVTETAVDTVSNDPFPSEYDTPLYILKDVNKDASVQISNLQKVLSVQQLDTKADGCFDIDAIAHLSVSSACSVNHLTQYDKMEGPSTLTLHLPNGKDKIIYTDPTRAILNIRFINPTTLLFTTQNMIWPLVVSPSVDQVGVFTINTDGTHLHQIASFAPDTATFLLSTAQNSWDTFSRDGSLYAIPINSLSDGVIEQYMYGSVTRSNLQTFATWKANGSDSLGDLIGWTTI